MKDFFKIPFNKPHLTHKELDYISHAYSLGQLSGDGYYTKKCHKWLENKLCTKKVFLTNSCTAAMEMMSLLLNIKSGDEVIMPSFTFSSTANAVVLRGGTPVFIDIRRDTLNINEALIENAITPKTKAIFVVHYAGVGCEMDEIKKIANKHNLYILEDAAHALLAKYKGKYLGTLGDMGAFSFHETKNITSGEGGALIINNSRFIERAEIIREKGTDRNQFFRGQVDKYTWVDVGSSYLPGEMIAAFLMAQLEDVKKITSKRVRIWNTYHKSFGDLEKKGKLNRPIIPENIEHNAHLYYLLVKDNKTRDKLIDFLKQRQICALFHYVPLHSSLAGKKYGRFVGDMSVTNKVSGTIIRLPLYYDITNQEVSRVIKTVKDFFKY